MPDSVVSLWFEFVNSHFSGFLSALNMLSMFAGIMFIVVAILALTTPGPKRIVTGSNEEKEWKARRFDEYRFLLLSILITVFGIVWVAIIAIPVLIYFYLSRKRTSV